MTDPEATTLRIHARTLEVRADAGDVVTISAAMARALATLCRRAAGDPT